MGSIEPELGSLEPKSAGFEGTQQHRGRRGRNKRKKRKKERKKMDRKWGRRWIKKGRQGGTKSGHLVECQMIGSLGDGASRWTRECHMASDYPLVSKFYGPIFLNDVNLTLADVFPQGKLNLDIISQPLDKDTLETIKATPFSFSRHGGDSFAWKDSSNGQFSSTIAYKIAKNIPLSCSFKLNTDGSVINNPGPATSRGLIRDHRGHWIKGFSRKIDIASSLAAEIWGIRDGLLLAKQLDIQSLIVEVDSFIAFQLLSTGTDHHHPLCSLISNCRALVVDLSHVHLQHVYREGAISTRVQLHLLPDALPPESPSKPPTPSSLENPVRC
ncbi:hypothetical protein SLEP1_g26858 [Rubroshorea leprosula]|uniref:RNase H type-1 domain-containing protein n=1 Tax=Rubroshorea leprosula TaxID=152421 RepID=A0AAV5JU00_9ROSI|nr:hypothetical protein SLEP1_g26858 [Rubroshorea leprosula]